MNRMGKLFWKRKGVGARKGRMTQLVNPQNYQGSKGWVMISDKYPDKEFHDYKEFQAHEAKLERLAEARAAKKAPKKTEVSEE